MVERVFHRVVFLDELLRGLRADAGDAGDVVRRVAHEAEDVAHLVDADDAPFREDFRDAERLPAVAHARGAVDVDAVVDELAEILVGRDHVGGEAGGAGLAGERADEVVGLVAVELDRGQVEGADEALYVGDGGAEFLGHFLAVGLVGLELGVARGRRGGVEDDGEMGRGEAAEKVEQRVGEAVNRGGVAARGGADRFGREGEMGAVDERHAVEEEELAGGFGHAGGIRTGLTRFTRLGKKTSTRKHEENEGHEKGLEKFLFLHVFTLSLVPFQSC